MDEVEELQNIENVCRLCLSTDEPKLSVFGGQESPVPLVNKIQACLSIQILATDRLSTQICAQCVTNINQWHSYKEECLRSQDKLRMWLEKHLETSPIVVSIKSEPVDLEFYEDNIEVISESTNESDLESTNPLEEAANSQVNNVPVQELTDNEIDVQSEQPTLTKDMDICIKSEPQDDYDTDCTIEIESITGSELLANQLPNKEDTIMEADSTQKFNASGSPGKKRTKRGPHTHFRGTRTFKQKCTHCQIVLHSKQSYAKHMERFHSEKQNGTVDPTELQDGEELIEDLEEELMSMEKDAPLTQVQQNIISQLKTFSCYTCQQNFSDRRATLSHIRQHMPDLRPYTCIACMTEFPDRSMFKLHCGASFECAMKIALVVPKHGEEKYFTCNMCLRSMDNRKELLSHLSKHSDKQYEELVSPSRSPPKLKPMAPIPTTKPKHPEIPMPYKDGDAAHNHICDLCGMIYRYKPNMLKHKDLCQRLAPEVRTSYRCIHCGMTYLVFNKFHSHITLDHRKKELTCAICNTKIRSPSDFLTHHEAHRSPITKKQPFETTVKPTPPVLNISSPIKDWDTFEAEMNAGKISSNANYSCALCNLEFTTRAELTEHRNLHLKVKIYSCVICRSMFSSAGALEIHMKDHGIEDPNERNANISCVEYGTTKQEKDDTEPVDMNVDSDPGSTKNKCSTCGKQFSNYANLRRHIRNIHKSGKPHIVYTDGQQLSKPEVYERSSPVDQKSSKPMLQCSQCSKAFVFQANLDLHLQTAHKNQTAGGYACDVCGKTFFEEASLKIHRGWHNRTSFRLTADIAADEARMKNLVTPKVEKPRTGDSPTRPARAKKSFPNPPPSKPSNNFQCQVCNDKFGDVVELRKHLWDVHCARNKAEKNFTNSKLQCELCMNVLPDEETYNMHMQWHKVHPILSNISKPAFPCEVCGKHYSSKKVLWRHKKLHKATTVDSARFQSMNKKPSVTQYSCNTCRKMFCSNQSLQRHKLNMHTNIFNKRSQLLFTSPTRFESEEPKEKRVKLEYEEGSPIPIENPRTGKKAVMCHVCRKFFPNMSVLYKHKQHAHKSRIVKNTTKVSNLECVPLAAPEGRVSCNICFKEFPGVSNLKQHFTVKHKNCPLKYACSRDGCKLVFPTPLALKTHEFAHISMLFSCNLCDRHVFRLAAMSAHMLTVHKTVYNAEENKNFHREVNLSTYMVPAAVDATCPICKIKYPNNRAMKIHYFKFHDTADN